VDALIDSLLGRVASVELSPARADERARDEILLLIEREVARRVRARLSDDARLAAAVKAVVTRQSDPYSAAESLLADLSGAEAGPDE
jgi:putative protein kinase ArgK-like GTPase of G3E family